MPEIRNLSRQPDYPYTYTAHGIIRGKDFNDLIEIIYDNRDEPKRASELLADRFDYHVINDYFPDWNIQELTDFCRHTLILNKDAIGWDIVDTVMLKLNNITIPGWRIPNFDFIEEFNNVFKLVKKLYFPDRLHSYIKQILEETKQHEIQLHTELKSHLHLWSIRELWLLLSYLTEKMIDTSLPPEHTQLINLISTKFEEIITSNTINLKSKICLILLYIDAMEEYERDVMIRSKEFIDQIWKEINELSYTEKISFKYLLGTAYSMVGYHLFRQDTDFVSRKLFIDNFITNYITDDYDLGRWFADLVEYDYNELIFDLLIRGYSKTIQLLHLHHIELPPSKTKSRVKTRIRQFNLAMLDIIIYYLSIPDEFSDTKINTLSNLFQSRLIFNKTRMNSLELLRQVITSTIFYNPEFDRNKLENLLHATMHLLQTYSDPIEATIMEIDFLINTNQYPFVEIYEKIQSEITEHHSIVLSATFEDEIVSKVSKILDYTDTLSTRNDLFREIYEIVLQFLVEWMNIFSQDPVEYHEVLLILTPLINICMFQQIRWYYEQNFTKKAFLMNLNLHVYMQFYSHRLDRFENIKFETIKLGKYKGMSERYKEITAKWNVRELLKQEEVKEMIIDTRFRFKQSGLANNQPMGNLIEDDLIHGYLAEITRLEDFISKEFSNHPIDKLEEFFIETGIYQFGKASSTYRLERINAEDNGREIIPVPLFNNIHRLNVATDFFELQEKKIEIIYNRNKAIQHIYNEITDLSESKST